ncbi:MAG: hypothetical protein ACTSRU_18930, partial [Candidatus Hodarchaeales archaeon]
SADFSSGSYSNKFTGYSDSSELNENPIPTSLEDLRELLYLAFTLKSEHGQELLYSLTMRFEMGP